MKWIHCNISDISSKEYAEIYDNLSPSRKSRIDRLKVTDDRHRSLAGEALLKRLLLEEYGIKDAVIESDKKGRPFLKGNDLFVSIAHCNDTVVCAIAPKPVGIDVELIRPIDLKISRRVCTAEEKSYLFSEEKEILHRFFEIWTAKEAYFKLKGTGIKNFKSVNIIELNRQKFILGEYFVQIVF